MEGFKPGMKERGAVDDDSGEAMEPMEEVPLRVWRYGLIVVVRIWG